MFASLLLLAAAVSACDAEAVRAELRRECDARMIAGAVVMCSGLERPVVEGFARLEPEMAPMREGTRFDVASLTKVFTAAVCARLAADGLIDVDAPFVRYLPECAVGPGCGITVRDLALHRSGFVTKNFAADEPKDPEVFRRRALAHMPAHPCPNAFLYACHNYILLGMIAERVAGKPLDRLGEELVFRPLGMKDTAWGPVPDDGRPIRCAYRDIEPGRIVDYIAHRAPLPIGNAGLFTTAADVSLFLRDLLSRKAFKPAYYGLLLGEGRCADGAKRSFGFDMRDGERPAGVSARAVWHTGSTGQTMLADPETGFWAVVLTSRWGKDCMEGHDACIVARREIIGMLARGCAKKGCAGK